MAEQEFQIGDFVMVRSKGSPKMKVVHKFGSKTPKYKKIGDFSPRARHPDKLKGKEPEYDHGYDTLFEEFPDAEPGWLLCEYEGRMSAFDPKNLFFIARPDK